MFMVHEWPVLTLRVRYGMLYRGCGVEEGRLPPHKGEGPAPFGKGRALAIHSGLTELPSYGQGSVHGVVVRSQENSTWKSTSSMPNTT